MVKRVYGKTTRELMREYAESFKDDFGKLFLRKEIRDYFQNNFPKIKKGTIDAHISRLTTNNQNRLHYSVNSDGQDDVFYQLPDKSLRLYDREKDSAPIYIKGKIESEDGEDNIDESVEQTGEFAYERDLKFYLSKNLPIIENGLSLYQDEDEEIQGIEYPVGGRFIDLLAVDKNNDLVVIELKVSKGYDRVIGQLLRYIGWIKENLAEKNQKVRGIIIARNISEDLIIACKQLPDVELFEYELSIDVAKV